MSYNAKRAAIALVFLALLLAGGSFIYLRWSDQSREPRIAVVLPSSDNPFWIEVRRGVDDAKKQLEGKYRVAVAAAPGVNAQTQVDFLRGFLDRKEVDALVLGPASNSAPIGVLERYAAAKIPIVVIDSELESKEIAVRRIDIASFIGSDNFQGGQTAAQAMAAKLGGPSKRVLLLRGSQVHQSAIDRAAGFEDGARKAGLDVVAADGEWLFERAQQVTSGRVAREKIDGIFASNDVMALGAVAGLKSSGVQRDAWPVVIGYDATSDALQAIQRGEMFKSIKQDPRLMGREGVLSAVMALEKNPTLVKKRMLGVTVAPE